MVNYVKLGDIGEIFIGLTYKPENVSTEGMIVLRSSNIQDGELDFNDTVRVNCPVRENLLVKPNDILMCSRNGSAKLVGKCTMLPRMSEPMTFGAFMTIIRTPYNSYLRYFFDSSAFRNQIKGSATTTINQITRKMLDEIEVPVFDVESQIRITTQFEKLSKLIAMRKEQLAKLDELVKARFVEMFGNVESNPNGHPVKNFDEISTLITDGEHATPRRTDKGIYLLSARNVLNHALQLNDVDYIDEEEYARIARRVVPQAGDVLISCSGSIGRCCLVPNGLKFQMVRSAAVIRFNDEINPIFAEWLITSDELQRQILQSATQSSQANLFQGKIRKLHGYVPPLELQNQFATFVEQTNKTKLTIQASLDKLEVMKKALMQEYFG